MWALIVAVSLMLNGALFEDKMTYTGATWKTEQECKDFMASEAGQSSLANLKVYLQTAADVGTESQVTIAPSCVDIDTIPQS